MLSKHQINVGASPLGFSLCAPATPAQPNSNLKTRQQVRDEFARKGMSYTAWARQHGYSSALIIAIISDTDANPRYKCLRGDAHNAAVQLGLKAGEISRTSQRTRLPLAA